MAFIKHGEGKIVGVVDENDLTEEQKKIAKKKTLKNSEEDLSKKMDNDAN